MLREKSRQYIKPVLAFLISLTLCLSITYVYIDNKNRMEHAQMEQLLLTNSNKVNNVITKLLYKTQVLSALVIQNNGQIKDFDHIAATILDDPAILNVILAPNGVVSDVYPLEGNERVLGLNYFAEGEGNMEAVSAKETGQLVLGGPFNLVQGGQALVGRLPVYLGEPTEENFWGLVSVTLKYPEALNGAELEQLKNQGFAFEIWRISPDTGERQIISHSNYTYNKNADYVENPLNLLNADWYFRLSPIRRWYQYPETWIFGVCGIIISLLFSSLLLHNQDLRKIRVDLEDLTIKDPLTGILNRRGIFRALEKLTANPKNCFVLLYLDLNKFKAVNDTFGHAAGDLLLQQFARMVELHFSYDYLFARIGGDEFVLIIKDCDQPEALLRSLKSIESQLQGISFFGIQDTIDISFSIGTAVFPKDGSDVDDLIRFADNSMYQCKEREEEQNRSK